MKKVIDYVMNNYYKVEILFLITGFLILLSAYTQWYLIGLFLFPINISLLFLLIKLNLGYHHNERQKRDSQTNREEVSGNDF